MEDDLGAFNSLLCEVPRYPDDWWELEQDGTLTDADGVHWNEVFICERASVFTNRSLPGGEHSKAQKRLQGKCLQFSLCEES